MVSQLPFVEYLLEDGSGSQTTRRYYVPFGTPIAACLSAATALRGHLAALTGCEFISQTIHYPGIEPNPLAPLPGVLAERAGLFVFSCAEPDAYAILVVPGIRDDLLLTDGPWGGRAINQEHPAVVGFVAILADGFCNPFGVPIVALEAAFLQVQVVL